MCLSVIKVDRVYTLSTLINNFDLDLLKCVVEYI